MKFSELEISEPILRALNEKCYLTPTPIQEQAIPIVLEGGDMFGLAQTGTGKTAAFAIPIIEQLLSGNPAPRGKRPIKALVLTPTRELAIQIADSFAAYARHTKLRHTVIFGGVGQKPQVDALRAGTDILIATPGRLLDFIAQKVVSLAEIKHFVLDEADRMLDMGFIHDIRRLLPLLPKRRQTLLFSATMPAEIVNISKNILHNPKRVEVTPVSSVVESISQRLYFVEKPDKINLLSELLLDQIDERALIFSRTKYGADKIAKALNKRSIGCEAIHGNKSQNARQSALKNFKSGKTRIIVATDIAARGIDIQELGVVINFDLPEVAETYVHRIGRTGRAGCSGVAYSFCTEDDRPKLKSIEKLTGRRIEIVN
ncbi:MAG: DEAD/DEAH box helicase [Rikenellaceae bacterium]